MINRLELLDFLRGLGFDDPKLEANITKLFEQMPATGLVPVIKMYGAEQMRYDLKLEHDRQFQAYRLAGFKATHRDPLVIEHKNINGIDTALLESRMQREDWQDYFGEKARYKHPLDKDFVSDTLTILGKLADGQNFDGLKIQQELRFKYWPLESYDDDGKQDLIYLYENNREFTSSPYGICNANLAYHILSGNLNQLHELLSGTELDEFSSIDLYSLLELHLSNNEQSFEIKSSKDCPEGIIDYCIPINRTDSGYTADVNQVTYTPFPDINHGVYNGVDSEALEQQIKSTDWETVELFVMVNDDPELLPPASRVKELLDKLSEDKQGAEIAEYLLLRYWSRHAFLETFVPQESWEKLESWPKIKHDFPLNFDAKSIYNLMAGRAVIAQPMPGYSPAANDWFRLDTTSVSAEGIHPIQLIKGLSSHETEQLTRMLPLDNVSIHQVVGDLLKGDYISISAKGINGNQELLLKAHPEENTLQLFTIDHHPIAFNFHLNPEWKQPQERAEKKVMHQQSRPIHPFRKHKKGRGI